MGLIFNTFLSQFVIVYVNDILIFSFSDDEHLLHISKVFKVLANNALYVNVKKCTFLSNKVLFLGYIALDKGIQVDDYKVKEILE